MADGRKRSAAKQARRDARRRKARQGRGAERETSEEVPLIDEVREALDGGQPLDLLGLVSMLILATSPRPALLQAPDVEDPPSLDELVAAFIEVQVPETTALLAIFGELMPDGALSDRCRREVDARCHSLPHWLAALAHTSVHKVVRMAHVLGDGEELLLGVRLADGQELTCAVYLDHLEMSEVTDAFFVPETIDTTLDVAKRSNDDPDTSFTDLGLIDARALLQKALNGALAIPRQESDTWPGCRALVQWLTRLMPDGGPDLQVLQGDSVLAEESPARFFASPVGMPFDDVDHRDLLELCIEAGTGDPLRWSARRLRHLLNAGLLPDAHMPLDVHLDLPELLCAFVPFAHAESGIRPELTAEALAAIDEMADHYRATVLEDARYQGYLDDD